MVDMADADDDVNDDIIESKIALVEGQKKKVKSCSLPKETQNLIELIFSNDMFQHTLKEFEIDVKKMPLGNISQTQIKKGMAILEQLKGALDNGKTGKTLEDLTSQFYTIIPHSFGRNVPPVIKSAELLQKKVDLLNVLSDIEIAQGMKENSDKVTNTQEEDIEEIDHPHDVNYQQLCNNVQPLNPKSEEYSIIEKYIHATSPHLKIKHLYTIDRQGEKERFDEHSHLSNRKLLWHGTNVAVVCAILKTGLRIMPHSGGRVGRGLYFASENDKSAGYVGTSQNGLGVMFLNEVALGQEYHITKDDSSLKSAPMGYDSVVAQGRTEPNPFDDVTIQGDYGSITVPVGKVEERKQYSSSYFSQTEYLVYKESQVRMKYMCLLDFGGRGW
jgi:poly [ADP-ribose] polymerase 2/3/4